MTLFKNLQGLQLEQLKKEDIQLITQELAYIQTITNCDWLTIEHVIKAGFKNMEELEEYEIILKKLLGLSLHTDTTSSVSLIEEVGF